MAEYFRKVTYLQEFKNDVSIGNAGYGRLFFHEETCTIQIHIKKESFCLGGQVYGCYLEKGTLFLVLIGELEQRETGWEYEENTERKKWDRLRNLVVLDSEKHYYSDKPLTNYRIVMQKDVGEELAAAECLAQERVQPEEVVTKSEQKESKAKEGEKPWYEFIMTSKDAMYPFEDDEMERCVKIEPDDLMMLPSREWALAKNSFLLQGAYSYRHLLFVMREEDGKNHYYIGVPGVFHKRDRFMAGMFGFPFFKGVRKKEEKFGDFGYWLREIRE